MRFEGDKQFPLPPDALAAKLGDAAFLVGCLVNAEDVAIHGPDSAAWKMRPTLSFMTGTLDSRLEIIGASRSDCIRGSSAKESAAAAPPMCI